jgi:hypothetical protein
MSAAANHLEPDVGGVADVRMIERGLDRRAFDDLEVGVAGDRGGGRASAGDRLNHHRHHEHDDRARTDCLQK